MTSRSLFFILLLSVLIAGGCTNGDKSQQASVTEEVSVDDTVIVDKETLLLIRELKETGDYVNSREFPSLIKASVVYENLGNQIHIIDLRASSKYAQGHIKGAVNKRFEDLPEYFESGIKPFEFDKIIFVCEDGQISSYAVSLLRLMGYGNVYAMRWGMSSWNKQFAEDTWLRGLSGKYEDRLEKTINERPPAKEMPVLKTGLSTGAEIASARYKKLFEEGTDNVLISAEEVFSNPSKYFVINYERKDKYEDSHIPGAVRYKPNSTLGFTEEMGTIPTDKTVVIYCGTGHNSAFATAYMRLLGYDARTLRYGNNSFMYNRMKKDISQLSWLPFTENEINNYEVVKN